MNEWGKNERTSCSVIIIMLCKHKTLTRKVLKRFLKKPPIIIKEKGTLNRIQKWV